MIYLVSLLSFIFLAITPVFAQAPAKISDLQPVLQRFLGYALGLVGIGVVVMLMIGGFKYLMAGADKEGTAKAQKTITYAIIGLTLAVSSWLIVSLISNFLGVGNLLQFDICLPGSTC